MADKNKLVVRILVLIIVLLALAVLYAFVLRPTVTEYVTDKQVGAYNQGYMQAWNDIYSQWAQTGYAQIPLGENQVLVLQGQIAQTQPAQ